MSTFDVVVIGGGPAGMMAAARAAQYGARTALIEKNRDLGRKLMITGRGRCNFAHAQDDPEKLAADYRNGGDFLLPALQKFGTKETVAFFLRRGLVSAEERGHRIYPKEGQDASSVVNALWTALKDGGVQVLRGLEVRAFDMLGGVVRRVTTAREEIDGRAFIIATGGLSFPNTGSTGDGYRWARKAGHTIAETHPALCPVKIAEHFEDNMNGLKLKNVRVTLRESGQAVDERFGEMDFTPFGVSGAIIMDMASSIGEALKRSPAVTLHIDLKPALEPERLDARIARDFEEFSGDALRFAVRKLLPKEIIPDVLKKAGLDMGKPCGQTTPEERAALRDTLKDFSVTPTELLGFRHAIITAGGVDTAEVEPETMRSRLIPNLYFAGEVLNVDGPTGGYNLQECWSTGFAAGSAAAASLGFAEPTDSEIVEQMEQARNRRDERAREERLREQERRAAEAADSAPDTDPEHEEEPEEDMTIQTGPTDDREFCGWRDPRKKETAEEKTTPSAHEEKREERSSRQRSFSDRPRFRDGERRERDFEDRPRFRDGERRERDFDDRPRFRDGERRERSFDDRPRFRDGERRERSFDDRPRFRDGERRERNFDDRPRFRDGERRERDFDDRPRFRDGERRERSFDDRPRFRDGERRERNFDDRPRDSFRPHYRDDERRERFSRDGESRFSGRERPAYDRPRRDFRDERGDDRPFSRERAPRPYEGERRSSFHSEGAPQDRGFAPRRERPFDEHGDRRGSRSERPASPRREDSGDKPRARRFTNFQKFRKNSEE